MKNDPKYILLKEEYDLLDGGKGPVFGSQTDMAECIVKVSSAKNDKDPYQNVDSLKPFLSQVLKPRFDSQSRPLSKRLKQSIIDACYSRLRDNQEIRDKFLQDFDESIKAWKDADA